MDKKFLKLVHQNLKAILEGTKAEFERIQPVFTQIEPQILELAKRGAVTAESLKNFLTVNNESFSSLVKSLINAQNQTRTLRQKLHREDLWLSPFFTVLSFSDLYDLFCNDNRSVLEIYSDYFSNRTNLDTLLDHWKEYPIYQDRLPILSAILHAHFNKTFELSIPVACTQIEGIFKDHFKLPIGQQIKPQVEKMLKDLGGKKDWIGEESVLNALIEAVFQSTGNFPDDLRGVYPNRHEILHGTDTQYFKNPFFSIRLILILDFMRYYMVGDSEVDFSSL